MQQPPWLTVTVMVLQGLLRLLVVTVTQAGPGVAEQVAVMVVGTVMALVTQATPLRLTKEFGVMKEPTMTRSVAVLAGKVLPKRVVTEVMLQM